MMAHFYRKNTLLLYKGRKVMTNNYSTITNGVISQSSQQKPQVIQNTAPQTVPVQAALPAQTVIPAASPTIQQPQYVPQGVQSAQYCNPQPVQTVPVPTANGVNIVVYNPQVTPNANVSNVLNYPQYNGTTSAYPQNYYTMPPVQKQQNDNGNQIAAANLNANIKKTIEQEEKEEKPKPIKEKEIVQLTDEYIKVLESYLDNQDPQIRTMAVKELIKRFEEDRTRKSDLALTALLNKALQDPKDSIRFLAMTILNSGYATGDELTSKLIANIQAQGGVYGDDAVVASQIHLNNAGNKIRVPDTSIQEKK